MAITTPSPADRLRHLAIELETLADAMERPSRTTARADMLIAECERIASDVRAVVRGSSPSRTAAAPLRADGGRAWW